MVVAQIGGLRGDAVRRQRPQLGEHDVHIQARLGGLVEYPVDGLVPDQIVHVDIRMAEAEADQFDAAKAAIREIADLLAGDALLHAAGGDPPAHEGLGVVALRLEELLFKRGGAIFRRCQGGQGQHGDDERKRHQHDQ